MKTGPDPISPPGKTGPDPVFRHLSLALQALDALTRSGLLVPVRPDRAVRSARALRSVGVNAAGAVAAGAARHPDRAAITDDDGTLTWSELDAAAAAFAVELRDEHGIDDSRPLAIMCRNGRGFAIALVAAARIGCDVVLMNTEFAAPQVAELLPRENVQAALVDEEFVHLFAECVTVTVGKQGLTLFSRAPTPWRRGNVVILTSGTTGTPKGAQRDVEPLALLGPMVTMLKRLRLRSGEPVVICPPLFHGLGLALIGLALFMGCPVVVRRKFDARTALEDVRDHDAAGLVVVPVMLRRMLELDDRPEVPSLRAVVCGGAALAPRLGEEFMNEFGDVLFNVYGSTETGWAGVATPADLRAAPGTVGRPPIGCTVKIIRDGRELPAGETGGIYVGGDLVSSGYSGGGAKTVVDGLSSTGDLGHFDADGRLFVEGRDDDMIVSGGENVFPQEVEETLARHEAVADVAVVGVEDDKFGQRLAAYVVARDGEPPDPDELKAWVKSNLARFKVPRDVIFVDDLPRTATGKVRKRDLAA